MRIEMVMPQMGESITEGTIVRWTKRVGESVGKDENVLDISTDKVDSEIPSPAAGRLVEIRAKEGETIPVGQVIAVIETEGSAVAAPGVPMSPAPAVAAPAPAPVASVPPPVPAAAPASMPVSAPAAPPAASAALPPIPSAPPMPAPVPVVASAPVPAVPSPATTGGPIPRRDGERFYSPLVRSMARTEGVDAAALAQIRGSGRDGRVTKDDLVAYIAARKDGALAPTSLAVTGAPSGPIAAAPLPMRAGAASPPGVSAPGGFSGVSFVGPSGGSEVTFKPYPAFTPVETRATGDGPVEVVKMDVMRQRIAEHMVRSKATSPHVYSVTECDMTGIVRFREAAKAGFERQHGFNLTYTPFIVAAAVRALLDYPMMNASAEGTEILVKRFINVGVAVALDSGLIVPVVKHAEEKSFLGLARAITDLAARARAKKLIPDEVAGGTFAVTNMGSFGNLFGLPIINQPNVGILGAGAIVKRPVVIGEAIAVRDIMYLSLSYDHRVVDGALGGYFIQRVRHYLEKGDLAAGIG